MQVIDVKYHYENLVGGILNKRGGKSRIAPQTKVSPKETPQTSLGESYSSGTQGWSVVEGREGE